MTRRLQKGEAYIESYGVESDPGAPTLREKADAMSGQHGRTRELPVSALTASDPIVSAGLVKKYAESREWESRPIEAVVGGGDAYVVDGHHRLAAASQEGAGAIQVVVYG